MPLRYASPQRENNDKLGVRITNGSTHGADATRGIRGLTSENINVLSGSSSRAHSPSTHQALFRKVMNLDELSCARVVQSVVAWPDDDGPRTRVIDTVLFPNCEHHKHVG